jgi:serine protease Do
MKDNLKKRGKTDAAKALDNWIKMGFGTGFVYVAPDGVNYVITNYHVVAQTTTLSISFEKMDGAKTTYDRLKVVAADEDIDIAILTFADGAKPFTAGLSFVTAPAEEGSDVFAAGFPGLGIEQIWQFSRGVISNARMRFPRDPVEDVDINEARFGPFIQHTATIDHGNSGGPLLVLQPDVTSGYAVTGINAMGWRGRASTFFAIPADRALTYITEAFKPKDDAVRRQNLDTRLDAFIKALAKPKAVYAAIADYLSNACAASNAEYAIMETTSRATRLVREAIEGLNDPVDGMKYSVAWLVEDSFRGKTTGALQATLGDITQNSDGSYTVPLKLPGNRVVNTTWVTEYGMWKLDKAGDLVSGDKSLVAEREKQKERDKKKKDYNRFLMLSVGYTQIFDHKISKEIIGYDWGEPIYGPITGPAPALDIALLYAPGKYSLYRISFDLADKFWQLDANIGFKVPIDIKAVTLAPYATVGVGFGAYESILDFRMAVPIQAGLMVTTTWVPGLYFLAGYQYNLDLWAFISSATPSDTNMLKINLGYAFAL